MCITFENHCNFNMAIKIKPEIIKRIVDELDCGFLCFYHKTTGELESYPDENSNPGFDEELWEEVMDKVSENLGDYLEFEPMRGNQSFRVMENFVGQIDHIPTHNKFIDALSRKKPFANFKNLLNYYPDLLEQWYVFKNEAYIEYVKDQLDIDDDTDDEILDDEDGAVVIPFKLKSRADDITIAIGNTPLVKLNNIVPDDSANVYIKLEYFNPTGSYKDRMALSIIENGERRGDIKPGATIVECTGGSTGVSLALVCGVKGYKFHVISSDAFAKEKLQSMRIFGADLEIMPSEGGKITPDLIPKMIARANEIGAAPGNYLADQFKNPDVLDGYSKMAAEILDKLDVPVDVFCGAVGTAGMAMGVSRVLKDSNPETKVVILEPASAPLLSKGKKGSHTVDGIGVGFVPPFLDKKLYNEVRAIDEAEARTMVKLLAEKEGIFAGTSTGMNVVAALQIAKELGPGHTVVTVAVDSGMKYLSSGLFD